jgi:hypothetical protein
MADEDLQATCSIIADASHQSSEKKKERYMNLLQRQVQPYFPKFLESLISQSIEEQDNGRCAVVEFTGARGCQVTNFTNTREITTYLVHSSSSSLAAAAEAPARRRLFVMEDLPRNYILSLGSYLRIPPSFFADHWADPCSSTFNHRNPFWRCALPHFRLRYATSQRVEVVTPSSSSANIFAFDARVSRHLFTYTRGGQVYDEAKSHHAVSFWTSQPREDGSWDAVLLVDPAPGTRVRCLRTGMFFNLQTKLTDESSMPDRFLYPEVSALRELPVDDSQWSTLSASPQYGSMFEETIHAFEHIDSDMDVTSDPLSATNHIRRLVASTTIAYLRRRYLNLVNIQKSDTLLQMMRQNYLASFSKNSYASWSSEFFDFIVGSQAAVKVFSREMEDNITALGLNDAGCLAPQWERDVWLTVKELTAVVAETIDAFANGYLQYVTIQEARASSGNAKSLSRITVLTMLFIPLSTVASILSMSGDFLPGQAKSWVFWAVALPLLAMIAYLYWRQVPDQKWRRKHPDLLPLFKSKCAE